MLCFLTLVLLSNHFVPPLPLCLVRPTCALILPRLEVRRLWALPINGKSDRPVLHLKVLMIITIWVIAWWPLYHQHQSPKIPVVGMIWTQSNPFSNCFLYGIMYRSIQGWFNSTLRTGDIKMSTQSHEDIMDHPSPANSVNPHANVTCPWYCLAILIPQYRVLCYLLFKYSIWAQL